MRILIAIFFTMSTLYSQSPSDVVQSALTALTNGDIKRLLTITANAELRQVEELLKSIESSPKKKDELLQQYRSLKSWSIEESTEHKIDGRTIAIVSTKWIVQNSLETDSKKLVTVHDRAIYVDYMLEKHQNQWKIISRKSLN
ncbi:MAG: hypothetical protein ACRCWI_06630 [Brevinema sp.]